jgi:hypothetical protein
MKNIALIIIALLLSGCGATSSQANNAPLAGPEPSMVERLFGVDHRKPLSTPEARRAYSVAAGIPLIGACPMGTPRAHCMMISNDVDPSLALVVARIDNVPIMIFPYGGLLPLPRLLNGEKTQFVLPRCTKRDKSGDCVYKLNAELYEVTDATIDPILSNPELTTIPVVSEDTRHCYELEFTVPRDGRSDRPAVSVQWWHSKKCPNLIVPKGKEKVAANDLKP